MESASAPAPYFCFKCNKYLHPEHVQNYQCRFCNTGFIEEIHPGINNLTDDGDTSTNNSGSNSSGENNGVNVGQLLGMLLGGGAGGNGGGVVIGGNIGGGGSNRQRSGGNGQQERGAGGGTPTASDFIQTAIQLLPAFMQAMQGNATPDASNTTTRRSASTGPSSSNRRHGAGSDGGPQQQQQNEGGGGFFEDFIRNLAPANAQIRIQFGGNGGGIQFGNVNLGDFATDAGFDEIVTQILNQFDPTANNQRISEEDLQHLPRSKVTQTHVDNEAQCTTCMDQFSLNEEVGELGCHHIFHPDCIIPWLRNHNTCPVCRQTVDPDTWRENPVNPVPPQEREGFKDGDELD